MTISVGAVTVGTGNPTVATPSATTNASGSTFYAVVIAKSNTGPSLVLTDTFGNTYAQIGTAVSDSTLRWLYRYQAVNGAGGSGHVLNVSQGAGTDQLAAYFVEIVGGATVSPLDQSNAYGNAYATNPTSSGSITITPNSNSELLISTYLTEAYSSTLSFTEANGFVVQALLTDGISYNASALGTQIVSAAGTYSAAWSCSQNGNSVIAVIDSFQGGSAGGGGGALQYGAINAGRLGPKPGIGPGGPNFQPRNLSTQVTPNPNVTVALTGTQSAFIGAAFGLVSDTESVIGVASALSVGTLIPSISPSATLTGNSAAFATGSISGGGGNLLASLTGVSASFAAGTLLPSISGINITLNLVGAQAVFSANAPAPNIYYDNVTLTLSGLSVSCSIGSVTTLHFTLPAIDMTVLQTTSAYFK